MNKATAYVNKWGERLASPSLVFWLLPYLMILVVVGTVAQKYVGLFAATQTYFSSLYFTVYGVPLPGGYLIIALITVNLLAKLVFKSEWSWRQSGIILTHIGVLILFIGGLLTVLTAKEGFIYLEEGDETAIVSSYWEKEMIIATKDEIVALYDFDDLTQGETIKADILPFSFKIDMRCAHCSIKRADENPEIGSEGPLFGPAQFMALEPAAPKKEVEENIAGLRLHVFDKQGDSIGETVLFDGFPKPVEFETDGRVYQMALTKKKSELPFSIKLHDFIEKAHPGTTKTQDYLSHIEVHDQGVTWPVTIEMNEPFRYRGYSFYQSSFDKSGNKEATILSVVENKGWLFPYIASFILALGLIIHALVKADIMKKEKLS